MTWLFVDDKPEEAEAFAQTLRTGTQAIVVEVARPKVARERLLRGRGEPSGVLMDVDLSVEPGDPGSGPGFAQDLRVDQRAGKIVEYPIVRFAAADRVDANVAGDPTSDDLFDLKIQKEELRESTVSVQSRLMGVAALYTHLIAIRPQEQPWLSSVVALEEADLAELCHRGFRDRFESSLQVGVHVAAGTFMRDFITPTGLLIDERVLSYRLGVDRVRSGDAWTHLRESLPFRYRGTASDAFQRWWARGLENWWATTIKDSKHLATLTIEQRITALNAALPLPVTPLEMPEGSAGTRPWRQCAISVEGRAPRWVPVDPNEAVRFTPRSDLPPWADPLYAAFGPAIQEKHDLRLNRDDLARLQRRYPR